MAGDGPGVGGWHPHTPPQGGGGLTSRGARERRALKRQRDPPPQTGALGKRLCPAGRTVEQHGRALITVSRTEALALARVQLRGRVPGARPLQGRATQSAPLLCRLSSVDTVLLLTHLPTCPPTHTCPAHTLNHYIRQRCGRGGGGGWVHPWPCGTDMRRSPQ